LNQGGRGARSPLESLAAAPRARAEQPGAG